MFEENLLLVYTNGILLAGWLWLFIYISVQVHICYWKSCVTRTQSWSTRGTGEWLISVDRIHIHELISWNLAFCSGNGLSKLKPEKHGNSVINALYGWLFLTTSICEKWTPRHQRCVSRKVKIDRRFLFWQKVNVFDGNRSELHKLNFRTKLPLLPWSKTTQNKGSH